MNNNNNNNNNIPLTTLFRYAIKEKKEIQKKCDQLRGENDSLADEITYLEKEIKNLKQKVQATDGNGDIVTIKTYNDVVVANAKLKKENARLKKMYSIQITEYLAKKKNSQVSISK